LGGLGRLGRLGGPTADHQQIPAQNWRTTPDLWPPRTAQTIPTPSDEVLRTDSQQPDLPPNPSPSHLFATDLSLPRTGSSARSICRFPRHPAIAWAGSARQIGPWSGGLPSSPRTLAPAGPFRRRLTASRPGDSAELCLPGDLPVQTPGVSPVPTSSGNPVPAPGVLRPRSPGASPTAEPPHRRSGSPGRSLRTRPPFAPLAVGVPSSQPRLQRSESLSWIQFGWDWWSTPLTWGALSGSSRTCSMVSTESGFGPP